MTDEAVDRPGPTTVGIPSPQASSNAEPKRAPLPEGMSRNAWKREQKKQKWLEQKDARNKYKKEKKKQKKQLQNSKDEGSEKLEVGIVGLGSGELVKRRKNDMLQPAPITILIDCGFDDLMTEKESLSLSSQITRCYSENRRAVVPVNLRVSSFNGSLQERFDSALKQQYKYWKGILFSPIEYEVPESDEERSRIIYLSSDSDETLTELEDNKTYIVGGIVDKGRYKSLCLNKANSQKIKTAKLPISEFINISGRKVLTTNHVVEIMLKWIELRDWKSAFEIVIPPRKQEGFESARLKRKREGDVQTEDLENDGVDEQKDGETSMVAVDD
ncbi:guanine-1-methyltransferase-domain-containing protein [Lipomyces tetrasporus]|uniref:tRNA (guanine(9)-N1)-methyltransferase n=1 Tax=Lipomyces tetrasporus TaxID=54092 RepID=A0AAD7QXT1_9ASCO|nr:guanine-1-methyltransferase-domain-containing protein [Lipomyces tetrasporus]KAJ8101747.1 guanine-1-methyltransferase-domain-containing protein [Lipomyces tetrasporus]